MPPLPLAASIVVLSALLAIVSALAGMLWWRLRTLRAYQSIEALVQELAKRLQEVETILERLESIEEKGFSAVRKPDSPPLLFPKGPPPDWRVDPPASGSSATGPTLIAVPNLAGPLTEILESTAEELTERYRPIWEQADSGESPEAIARSSGLPIGQVELILGLRRQLPMSGNGNGNGSGSKDRA